jgi:hypothetical protein
MLKALREAAASDTSLTEGRGWSVARTETWLVKLSSAAIAGGTRR